MIRLHRGILCAGLVLALAGCAGSGTIPTVPAAVTTASSHPTPTPTKPSVEQRAASIVAAMTPAERAGTVLMTAGTVPQLPGLAATVRKYHLGGVMVRGRSAAGTTAVAKAFGPVRSAVPKGLPLLTATDQEGGLVQVLSGPGFAAIPTAVRQGTWSASSLRSSATTWGRSLAAAGVHLDLAPVADVPCATTLHDNPPVAALYRQYGSDPVAAGRHVAAFVAGMHAAHVDTAVKHFPGLGCVRANTDTTAHVVDAVTTTTSPRLQSFAAGIGAGAGFVMVSSASYSKIDPGVPALFSTKVIGLLRGRMGFEGVVMSDDVGLAVALKGTPMGQRATRFIAAGGDLLLDVNAADVRALSSALTAKAWADPVFGARLRQAAEHVVAARLRTPAR